MTEKNDAASILLHQQPTRPLAKLVKAYLPRINFLARIL